MLDSKPQQIAHFLQRKKTWCPSEERSLHLISIELTAPSGISDSII